MAHGNTGSTKATAQNASTEPQSPGDQPREGEAGRAEPSTYAAADVRDSTLAAPAAGEIGDYADLDEPSGGMAQGRTHNDRELHAHDRHQGPKTQDANRRMAGSGSSDQGTH